MRRQIECLYCDNFFPAIGPKPRHAWTGEVRLCENCISVLAASPYKRPLGAHHVAENNGLGQLKRQLPEDHARVLGPSVGPDHAIARIEAWS